MNNDSLKSGAAELRQQIKKTLARIARIDENSFDEGHLIREELGIDSIMAIEIIATVEVHFQIKIDGDAVYQCETVGKFIDYILGLVSSQKHGE